MSKLKFLMTNQIQNPNGKTGNTRLWILNFGFDLTFVIWILTLVFNTGFPLSRE